MQWKHRRERGSQSQSHALRAQGLRVLSTVPSPFPTNTSLGSVTHLHKPLLNTIYVPNAFLLNPLPIISCNSKEYGSYTITMIHRMHACHLLNYSEGGKLQMISIWNCGCCWDRGNMSRELWELKGDIVVISGLIPAFRVFTTTSWRV